MKVGYERVMHAQAKRDGSVLVTLDVNGTHAKQDGVTYQGQVTDPGEVDYLWAVMRWLASGRYGGEPAPAYTPPKLIKAKPLKGAH